jgi:CheY-like chemotaxis protein/anti-sigma regulatory factor (Ser/Thr protein kinase)
MFDKRQQRLTIELPDNLIVDADPMRLAQAIANLLTNACKYTPPGGAITVTGERIDDTVAIRVRDTGVGIEPAMLPNVFDMFVQERQALDRSRGGLGLGLTIVKSLVEGHGGSVRVRSDGKNKGSEFEIRMPAGTLRPSPPVPEIGDSPTEVPGARVLVVDDNEDAAILMAETLARRGYATRTAHDAAEALEVCREWAPAAAVLDIGLPVVDGYQLAHQIRQLPGLARVLLIALTGYGQAADRERAIAAGFDRHLVKPVEVKTIRAILDDALSGIPGPR